MVQGGFIAKSLHLCNMKRAGYALLIPLSSCLLSGCGNGADPDKGAITTDTLSKKDVVTGGNCNYKDIMGKAKIISVDEFPPSYKGCLQGSELIRFIFISADTNYKASTDTFFGDTAYLQVSGGMEKMKIKPGMEFNCIRQVITEGTCTPVILEFPDDSLLSAKFCK